VIASKIGEIDLADHGLSLFLKCYPMDRNKTTIRIPAVESIRANR
jgi:hypothetical protein